MTVLTYMPMESFFEANMQNNILLKQQKKLSTCFLNIKPLHTAPSTVTEDEVETIFVASSSNCLAAEVDFSLRKY